MTAGATRLLHLLSAATSAALLGCFGGKLPPANEDASYGRLPDLGPLCRADNDGVIARGELQFPVGISVRYLVNPVGTTVSTPSEGKPGADGPEWDLTSTAGDVVELKLERVEDLWCAATFPGASYAVLSDLGSDTLGIYRVSDEALYLLGFASRQPDRTLLVYQQPVVTLRFPVRQGDAWVAIGKIVNGKLLGQPYAGSDTYRVTVDQRGAAVLPYLRFTNVLRVRVDLTQTLPAGIAVSRIQKILFRECYGELGRFVSTVGELDPGFTTAAEFRRLAL